MTLRALLAIATLLFTCPIFAQQDALVGAFSGRGLASTLHWEAPCKVINVELKRAAENVLKLKGGYKCSNVHKSWPARTFRLKKGSVYWEGERIGEYHPHLLRLIFDNGAYRIILQKTEADEFFFREMWASRQNFFLVEGRLHKQ